MGRAPVIALSHGGGPLPLLGDPDHAHLVESLRSKVPKLLKLGTSEAPRAIVVVTAHWSAARPTISNAKNHKLLFDYYGFPDAAYKFKYDAPGEPSVARDVAQALEGVGLKSEMDQERGMFTTRSLTVEMADSAVGWDHGVFVPMILINPSASIPIIQVSVLENESPADHFAMGQALCELRDSNVAIIASGFATFHNIRFFFNGATRSPAFRAKNDEWTKHVNAAVDEPDPKTRLNKFESWRSWPGSYEMHPRGGSEHFLPLIVAAGAGGEGSAEKYKDESAGLDMFSYYWN
ncbi:MAG: hypothetical protein M1828_001084 [Chrysothrix sp. TS-e1954]|nr:MAG: hypothetical protein M1828_001084 [Chrysothrix sp. TS-e1954]